MQKVGLVADVVRGMLVNEASSTLLFLKKSASLYVRKALMSSVANAQNNFSIDVDRLYVKEILVGKGMKLKRFAARARGRASRVHKHPTKSYQKKCPSKKAAALVIKNSAK